MDQETLAIIASLELAIDQLSNLRSKLKQPRAYEAGVCKKELAEIIEQINAIKKYM